MGVFEAVKKGIEAVKGLLPLMGIIFGINVVTSAGMLSVIGVNPTPEKITQITGVLMVLFMILMLIGFFLAGGIFVTILNFIKTKTVDLTALLGNCLKYFGRILIINIPIGLGINLVLWFAGAFLAGIFIAMGKGENPFFNVIGGIIIVVTVIIAVIVAIALFLGQSFVIINDEKAIAGLKKGIGFLKHNFWRVIGLFFSLGICILIPSFLVNFIGVLLSKALSGWALAIINIILSALVNCFAAVFIAGGIFSFVLGNESQAVTEEAAA
ncbi:MAG: hypothetical protein HY810_07785 [Candidatus Omnitrophica bacterium]|nr:hypothetical protein [Candidatus Omnitrophota bacterium]